jgi:hypothetical protein
VPQLFSVHKRLGGEILKLTRFERLLLYTYETEPKALVGAALRKAKKLKAEKDRAQ